jgi:hypothetical protein
LIVLSFRVTARSVMPGRAIGGKDLDRVVFQPIPDPAGSTGSVIPDGQLLASLVGDAIGKLKPGQTYTITITETED